MNSYSIFERWPFQSEIRPLSTTLPARPLAIIDSLNPSTSLRARTKDFGELQPRVVRYSFSLVRSMTADIPHPLSTETSWSETGVISLRAYTAPLIQSLGETTLFPLNHASYMSYNSCAYGSWQYTLSEPFVFTDLLTLRDDPPVYPLSYKDQSNDGSDCSSILPVKTFLVFPIAINPH